MKRSLIQIAVFLITLGTLVMLPACSTKFTINSDPGDAQIYLNETLVGKTPLELSSSDLPPTDNIRIKLVKEGYSTFSGIVPGPNMTSIRTDIVIALQKGIDEVDKINRNMGLLINAQKLVLTRKYNEAMRLVDQAIAENPRYIYAQLLKGSIYFLNKEFTPALNQYQKVIEIDPSNTEAIRMVNYLRTGGGLGRVPTNDTGKPGTNTPIDTSAVPAASTPPSTTPQGGAKQ